jgi:hypothetical protein
MPFLWSREVDHYKADIFDSAVLNYDRAIRLRLKPSGSEPAHTVSIEFPLAASSDFVSIGSTFSAVQIDRNKFDGMLDMLQTEKPLYFTAYGRAIQSAFGRRSRRGPSGSRLGHFREQQVDGRTAGGFPSRGGSVSGGFSRAALGSGSSRAMFPMRRRSASVRQSVSSLGRPFGKVEARATQAGVFLPWRSAARGLGVGSSA